MDDIKTLSDFIDRVRHTILSAPDHYSPYTGMNLDKSFESMYCGLEFLKDELATHSDKFKKHLDLSLAAYKKGDIKEGIRNLQEINTTLSITS